MTGFALGPRARISGYKLNAFDSVGSTNAEALAAARGGARTPQWFATSEQTAGRGRRRRPWETARGNLAATVLEVVHAPPPLAATLGFVAGLSLEAALRETCTVDGRPVGEGAFRLKWPNDVLADGAKLSGILLESEPAGDGALAIVAGIGVNVVSAPDDTPYPAVSLQALGYAVTAEKLFAALSDAWVAFRSLWDEGRGLPDIRRRWLARAAGVQSEVSIDLGGETVHGVFETIDDAGALIVVTADGRRIAVNAGDVHFGAAHSARGSR